MPSPFHSLYHVFSEYSFSGLVTVKRVKGSTINDLGAGPEEIEKIFFFDASSPGNFFLIFIFEFSSAPPPRSLMVDP